MSSDPVERINRILASVLDGTPVWLKDSVYYSAFAISAEIPVTIWTVFSPRRNRFLAYFALSLFFTLFMPALLTFLGGNFWPDAVRTRLTFLEDRWNVLLYLVVCPAYVAVCILILGASVSYWSKTIPGPGAPQHLAVLRNRRLLISLGLCLLVASSLIVNYIYDSVFNDLEYLYWFVDAPRVINRAGFYYVILNFGLLLITAVAILAYIGTITSALSEIRHLTVADEVALRASINHINDFWEIMTLARILAALYILNTYIWSFSPLGEPTAANKYIAVLFITLIGLGGTVLPKQVANFKFDQLRRDMIDRKIDPEELTEISEGINLWGRLADIVVVAGFPLSFVNFPDLVQIAQDILRGGIA